LGTLLQVEFGGGKHLVCRWGGDEFIVFFFDGIELLDAALERVTSGFLNYISVIEPGVDLSIGLSSLDGCRSVEDVFVEADRLMYKQKRAKTSAPAEPAP
jgi:GGDEF domain-containing protein